MSARTADVWRRRAGGERSTRSARWAFASRVVVLDVPIGGPLPSAPSTRAPRAAPPLSERERARCSDGPLTNDNACHRGQALLELREPANAPRAERALLEALRIAPRNEHAAALLARARAVTGARGQY
eukprot:CAMPEP_0180001224 /NCGR_PEP_ID=MMETSP0984-20121128/10279_1 /TAXON_ID=483367 /ORGANISM="non described non described, Strain CCMP 2436" /LENGTH=127 /DNA_ID=CAMNT_0021921317 /DNA_START=732 /DNA_END=1117 /DNA_ORIENTATION=+